MGNREQRPDLGQGSVQQAGRRTLAGFPALTHLPVTPVLDLIHGHAHDTHIYTQALTILEMVNKF